MDALTFISKVLEHGLWPAAAFGIVFYVIRNIGRISGTVSRLKVRDVEVEFRQKIEDVKQSASEQALTVFYPRTSSVEDQVSLAENRPQAFLVELTSEIEKSLIGWEKKQGKSGTRSPVEILDELKSRGIAGDDILSPARELLAVRNQYVHAENISLTSGEALELVGIARSVLDRLQQKLGR